MFDDLARHTYISLTTFRRDGRAVSTPVQCVADGDCLLVSTKSTTGKVKRLRHTPRATIVACDMRGRPKKGAASLDVSVHFVDPSEFGRAEDLMKQKYGLPQRILAPIRRRIERLLGRGTDPVWLGLRPS
jgi:uncharacterized protein